ncbi:hypothetical protein [Methylobacterium sp. E-066]|uniref:hypothetical protein n=1 Tax=Methylobacterium sp. E-066 TaxID=2836584 RepID=UPI001FBA523C|nr:hypothetical protein [Methylobacterium sp. E-066]MCJ2141567.1 hypothetical protein [Methylobacterium sp. E-066]
MSLRTSLKNLIRRDPAASLRERAIELRGTLSRRTIVAGSLAVAAPLPAISAPIVATPAQPHPDAALVALGERWLRAHDAQERAREEWGVAYQQVYAVIVTCPLELFASRDEQTRVLGGWRWPTLLGVSLRHVALDWGTEEAHTERAWTGDTGGAWPNLLRSAAHVAGIDPASLDHENDSINDRHV